MAGRERERERRAHSCRTPAPVGDRTRPLLVPDSELRADVIVDSPVAFYVARGAPGRCLRDTGVNSFLRPTIL